MVEEKTKVDHNFGGGEYCRVHFRVRCAAPMGQTVGIGGSTYRLGYFKKDRVVPLVTTPESYPVWYTVHPIVLPRLQLVHYKFCILQGGALKSFEKVGTDRTFMPNDPNTVVEGSFNPTDLEVTDVDVEASVLQDFSSKTPFDSNSVEEILQEGLVNRRLIIVCFHLPVVVRERDRPLSVTAQCVSTFLSTSGL